MKKLVVLMLTLASSISASSAISCSYYTLSPAFHETSLNTALYLVESLPPRNIQPPPVTNAVNYQPNKPSLAPIPSLTPDLEHVTTCPDIPFVEISFDPVATGRTASQRVNMHRGRSTYNPYPDVELKFSQK